MPRAPLCVFYWVFQAVAPPNQPQCNITIQKVGFCWNRLERTGSSSSSSSARSMLESKQTNLSNEQHQTQSAFYWSIRQLGTELSIQNYKRGSQPEGLRDRSKGWERKEKREKEFVQLKQKQQTDTQRSNPEVAASSAERSCFWLREKELNLQS